MYFEGGSEVTEISEEERRGLFVEQVRNVLSPYFADMSDNQKLLLDASLTRLFRKGRDVTDEEIFGRFEMITQHVSPRAHEEFIAAYRKIHKMDED